MVSALDGITGDLSIGVAATTEVRTVAPCDVAPRPHRRQRDRRRGRPRRGPCWTPTGCALTLQNGIGNVEALAAALGPGRVLGGLSYHSAALRGPGDVSHPHAGAHLAR